VIPHKNNEMTKNSPAGVGAKVALLVVALMGVFYFMSRLRSASVSEPQIGEKNPLAVLFGDEIGRPMNWCPHDVRRLQIEALPQEVVTDQAQIQSYCQILVEGFNRAGLDMQSFRPLLKAFGDSGAEIVIEADATGKVFRFQGLPFGSKQLSRQLDKKIQR
jgi:hypothetical protein